MHQRLKSITIALSASCVGLLSTDAYAATFVGKYGGSAYYLTSSASTWTIAQAEAVTLGGHLVTINDQSEQDWLLSSFGSSGELGLTNGVNGNRLWIGLNDATNEGDFTWISGKTVTYTNWTGGEPNSGGGSYEEDYVAMNWSFGGTWNDLPDAGPGFAPTYGIIEVSVPEPTSVLGLMSLGVAIAVVKKRSLSV